MSVESLVRLSQMQPEISAHEKSLDLYFELLKQGRFDENTALDSLKKGINYFLVRLCYPFLISIFSRAASLSMSGMKDSRIKITCSRLLSR